MRVPSLSHENVIEDAKYLTKLRLKESDVDNRKRRRNSKIGREAKETSF